MQTDKTSCGPIFTHLLNLGFTLSERWQAGEYKHNSSRKTGREAFNNGDTVRDEVVMLMLNSREIALEIQKAVSLLSFTVAAIMVRPSRRPCLRCNRTKGNRIRAVTRDTHETFLSSFFPPSIFTFRIWSGSHVQFWAAAARCVEARDQRDPQHVIVSPLPLCVTVRVGIFRMMQG